MGEGVIIGRGWPSDWSLVRYDAFDRPLGVAPRGDWGRGPSQSNVTLGLLFTPHAFLLISQATALAAHATAHIAQATA